MAAPSARGSEAAEFTFVRALCITAFPRPILAVYGWAIVILTCFLQILMFPLTIKSFKATLAMKRSVLFFEQHLVF